MQRRICVHEGHEVSAVRALYSQSHGTIVWCFSAIKLTTFNRRATANKPLSCLPDRSLSQTSRRTHLHLGWLACPHAPCIAPRDATRDWRDCQRRQVDVLRGHKTGFFLAPSSDRFRPPASPAPARCSAASRLGSAGSPPPPPLPRPAASAGRGPARQPPEAPRALGGQGGPPLRRLSENDVPAPENLAAGCF